MASPIDRCLGFEVVKTLAGRKFGRLPHVSGVYAAMWLSELIAEKSLLYATALIRKGPKDDDKAFPFWYNGYERELQRE